MTTTLAPWHKVMAGLRGARLAIYDDLLREGTVSYERLSAHARTPDDVAQALAWLERHRLLWRDGGGCWRASTVQAAMRAYETEGEASVAPWAPPTPARTEPPAPNRHVQQVSWDF